MLTKDDSGESPILDLAPLLEAFGSLDEHLIRTLHLFVTTTRPLLAQLAERFEAGDFPMAMEAAHSAKGASNMTGAVRLGRLCGEIDLALKAGEADQVRTLMARIPAALAAVEAAINRLEI